MKFLKNIYHLYIKSNYFARQITSFLILICIVIIICFVGVGWGRLILPITKSVAHTIFAGAGDTTLMIGLAVWKQ